MSAEIVTLKAEWASRIAHWHWDEWGHGDRSGSLESWTANLVRRAGRTEPPLLLVAVDGEEPIGSVSLVGNDVNTTDPTWSEVVERWKTATPWLSGLFVVPSHRRRGVGSALVEACIGRAGALGFGELYLYTSTAASMYERLGFAEVGRERYEGDDVVVMRRPVWRARQENAAGRP